MFVNLGEVFDSAPAACAAWLREAPRATLEIIARAADKLDAKGDALRAALTAELARRGVL